MPLKPLNYEGGGKQEKKEGEKKKEKRQPVSLQTINEKFDQLLDRMVDLERRIAASTSPSASRGATPPPKQKFEGHGLANGKGFVSCLNV